jgi:hypothetical protein
MSGTQNSFTYYLRKVSLVIGNNAGQGLDLSQMQFRFSTLIGTTETPNVLKLHIWNLSDTTAAKLVAQNGGTFEYNKVTLQAGYTNGPYGLIFSGSVLYMRLGREGPTDSYLDIHVADGDKGYNFAVVNTNLAPGASQQDAATAIDKALGVQGITPSSAPPSLSPLNYPRGLSLYGMARDHAAELAAQNGFTWSIQNGQSTYLAQAAALQTVVQLNAKTGMIGIPEQTIYGINVKSLLNPNFKPGVVLKLNNADINLQAQS